VHAEAAAICSHIVAILRDHGARELRTKARLTFPVEKWTWKISQRVGTSR
jgi:sulfite reductase beta subunit-like hemoprotein